MNTYIQLIYDVLDDFLKRVNNDENLLRLENNLAVESVKNQIVMNVISVSRQDINLGSRMSYVRQGEGYVQAQPPEMYQLLIAFHSMFAGEEAAKGFKILSHISAFIDHHNKFSPENFPQMLTQNLDSINVIAKTFNSADENLIWQKLGRPYVPTIYYEAGFIPVIPPVEFAKKHIPMFKTPEHSLGRM